MSFIYEISTLEKEGGDVNPQETRTRLESAKRLAEKKYSHCLLIFIDKVRKDDDELVCKWSLEPAESDKWLWIGS